MELVFLRIPKLSDKCAVWSSCAGFTYSSDKKKIWSYLTHVSKFSREYSNLFLVSVRCRQLMEQYESMGVDW